MLLVAALLAGCTGTARVAVKADHDPLYDFSRLRTYAWAPGRPRQDVATDGDPFLRSRLESIPGLIERELAARGFQPAGRQAPDFLVAYNVVSQRGQIDSFRDFGAYRAGGGSRDFSGAWVYGYDEGILTINVADARTERLIWRGSARAPLDETLSQEQRVARLQKAIHEMLLRFPPRPGP